VIREVARRVGDPPRRMSLSGRRDDRSAPPPTWLRPDDLISRIYAHQDQILRDGVVRWAAVVHANSTLFRPLPVASGAQVVYAREPGVPLSALREVARRAYALKGTQPADPQLRRLADMLTDEMERALDWPIPKALTGGRDVVTTIVMLPREQMPGGLLGLTVFPVLADPATSMAVLVPCEYWPDTFRNEWKSNADAVVARLDATVPVYLTPDAAGRVRAAAADYPAAWWLRVSLKPAPGDGYHYVLDVVYEVPDPVRDIVIESHGVAIVVAREIQYYLTGTEIAFKETAAGAGFVFNNPNE
jgi:iron-sulfur cluster assembly accessory protein